MVESLEYNSSFYGDVPPLPPYRPKQWKLLQMMIDGSSAGTNEERGLTLTTILVYAANV